MEAYFAFTDESGEYKKDRKENFKKAHPFYVRATIIISLQDFIKLECEMNKIKKDFGLECTTEIKWSHYGNALKKNAHASHSLSILQLEDYYVKVLSLLCRFESVSVYYTITDNYAIGKVDEILLTKMHIQNALQRVQMIMKKKKGFAILIADDLNNKTKILKKAIYEITTDGDYVKYTQLKKGLYIDFSDQCSGLQMADICVGPFTTSLKYKKAQCGDKHKYEFGNKLFFTYGYKKVRYTDDHPPDFKIHGIGVNEVPSKTGDYYAKKVSK